MSIFSTISKGIQLVHQRVSEDASKLNEKLTKSTMEAFDPGQAYGLLWESSDSVQFCRNCDEKFPPLSMTKHHCRSCAGVFCEKCCQFYSTDENIKLFSTLIPSFDSGSDTSSFRICDQCMRAECPGLPIKEDIRSQLETAANEKLDGNKSNAIEKLGTKFVNKVSGKLGLKESDEPPARQLTISYGSFYGEDGKPKKAVNRPLPVSGYFEIHNKSTEVFCVKVIVDEGNSKFEVPRPSYKAVPPKESAYSFFNPDEGNLHILILFGNPHPIEAERAINYNTTAPGMRSDRISKCAKVGLFPKVICYSCNSVGKNVLLKYVGNGEIKFRNGNAVSRIGLISRLQGRRFSHQMIDFASNIDNLITEFTLITETSRFYRQLPNHNNNNNNNDSNVNENKIHKDGNKNKKM